MLADAAFHGPIGSFVRSAEPHTEADPAAMLVTTLALFGASVNRGPHVLAGNDQHAARVFPLIVGGTSSGAKGTSAGAPRQLIEQVDKGLSCRMLSGFGSGEALVDTVADRDSDDDQERFDGRLVVFEGEFARVLRAASRDGSTLSMTIRDAWDGRTLQARSRARTSVASSAHVVVIGHVTAEELRVRLTDTESYSGFANRFLPILSARSKLLPDGGNVPDEVIAEQVPALQAALREARQRGAFTRTPEANTRWRELYRQIADDAPGGLLEATTARGAPTVLRLALIYALADRVKVIDLPHLEAAAAVWGYSRKSAAVIFADRQADPMTEKVLIAIKAGMPGGTTKTAIWSAIGRSHRAAQLDAVLQNLIAVGTIAERTESTGGRPRTVFAMKEEETRRGNAR